MKGLWWKDLMLSYSELQEELKTYTNPEVDQGPSEHSLSGPKGKQPEQEQTGLHRKWSLWRWTASHEKG